MAQQEYFAHTHEDGRTHELAEHLHGVAKLAEKFAAEFKSSDWAELAGRWHDLGKYRPCFQAYIKAAVDKTEAHIEDQPSVNKKRLKVEHSAAGAVYAEAKLGLHGRILAYLIAGHHAGLPDYEPAAYPKGALKARLDRAKKEQHLEQSLSAAIPEDILQATAPKSEPIGSTEGFHLLVHDQLLASQSISQGKPLFGRALPASSASFDDH